MKRKVLDLRTERGLRIFKDLRRFYCSLDYGFDKEILFSEGITHVIDSDGKLFKM